MQEQKNFGSEKIFMQKFLKNQNLHDVLFFGKILSAGLVVAGYIFLGVWLLNWLMKNGWSVLISVLVVILMTAFGMWQGWLFIRTSMRKKNSV